MTENENTAPRVIIDPFCPGNSHALVVSDITLTLAICACGNELRRITEQENVRAGYSPDREKYVHADGRTFCPEYDCECGQRHNINRQADPERYAAQGTQVEEAVSRALCNAGISAAVVEDINEDALRAAGLRF